MTSSDAGREFEGRRALVTGGSRGIAAELSRALARRGALVGVNFSAAADGASGQQSAAEALVAEIRAEGGRAVALEQDLMQDRAGEALAEKARAEIGPVDTLVLSASIQYHVPFLEQSVAQVSDQVRINLLSNIQILQGLLPDMVLARYGRILTIGSVQEVSPTAEMPIYSMTKAAMKNLVENLAVQGGGQNVIFNNIAPGLVATDRNAFRREDAEAWERLQRRANPVGRAGRPQDLTALAMHLLSPANSFTTGATIYATGGAHIPIAGGATAPRFHLPQEASDKDRAVSG
ncbi:SDR family NAD(P)-dependent oxidoreductase [Mameliella sp.]|uniref:SDR family NAD(P)-dependent oxidoreductase n=1 Tax=Mameliella sp. TaxID=1924940 RepID=UPI003BAB6A43